MSTETAATTEGAGVCKRRTLLPIYTVVIRTIPALHRGPVERRRKVRLIHRQNLARQRTRVPVNEHLACRKRRPLPFGLTVEDLEHGISKLRNHVIGCVFHALGLIEQWGSGIQRMTAAYREAGLDHPRFEEIATRFRVTIFTTQVDRPTLDDTDQAIVKAVSDGEGKSTRQIAAVIGLTTRACRTRLLRLAGNGLVREVGSGPQDPKRRYFLAKQHR